jgi:hypothetical protein
MKGAQPKAERQCIDCPTVFIGVSQQRRCDACRHKRKKLWDSQQHKKDGPYIDAPPEMIDRWFDSALAEIRRTKAHRIEEPSWDYRGRYREP